MFHRIRFETKDRRTRIFLDDTEVQGCVRAKFDYDVYDLPVVELTLKALDVEVDADAAYVQKNKEESCKRRSRNTRCKGG